MITARTVAQFFLAFANECEEPITNLKLSKLVYYTQAWHLTLCDGPLFDERIEAWVHGPVVPCLYEEYEKYGYHPIAEKYPDSDEIKLQFNADQQELLKDIIETYFSQTAYELERRTRREDPWIYAREGLKRDEPSHNVITHESMQRFYEKMLEEDDEDEDEDDQDEDEDDDEDEKDHDHDHDDEKEGNQDKACSE